MQRLTLRADNRQLLLVLAALAVSAVALAVLGFSRPADASSHREAPFISTDQQADATDVYAFRSPDRPNTVTLIANYLPAEEPAAGPNFYKFGRDVLYEINIDNDADARDDLSFQFRFKNSINNGDTFLYNTGPVTSLDDPDLNQEQFYSVSMLEDGDHNDPLREGKVLASDLQVAPANVGPVSYPDGYRKVANQARYDIGGGIKVFAGKLATWVAAAEQALSMDDAWEGLCLFLETMCELQTHDRGFNDFASIRLPENACLAGQQTRIRDLGVRIVERAREQGSLRPDLAPEDLAFIIWSHSRIIEATDGIAPHAWRRHLYLMLDGFRAERAHPLPEPPLTPTQLYRAMLRLGGADNDAD